MPSAPRAPLSAWRALMEAHSSLMRLYQREMEEDCGISLAWYDVLLHLHEAPGHTLRMAGLADRLLLSPSWLTRRIEGMEAAGLVRRCRATSDRRGVCAELTEAGVEAYRRAERSHRRAVRQHFLAHLDAQEAAVLETALRRVALAARTASRA